MKDIETEASNSDPENIKNCDIINEAVENYLTVVTSEVQGKSEDNPKWTTNKTKNTNIPCFSQVKCSSTQSVELLKETEASNSDPDNIKNSYINNEAV